MPITVPKRPINGEVDAIIESQVSPFVEARIASDDAAWSIALFGSFTRDRYVKISELWATDFDWPE
jgi:hypothetical protein